jgi:hypothetical protein
MLQKSAQVISKLVYLLTVTEPEKSPLPTAKKGSKISPPPKVISKRKYSDCTKPVILTTGLLDDQLKTTKAVAKKLGGTVVASFGPNVTHIVTSVDHNGNGRRTLKYFCGILSGIWILSYEWIQQCRTDEIWRYEEPFEIPGDTLGMGGPRKGRIRQSQKVRLFIYYRWY